MKIYIGSDHRGFELKNQLFTWLSDNRYDIYDTTKTFNASDDYPLMVESLVGLMKESGLEDSRGIVLCGSGVGVDIAANRFEGIRCALGFDESQVKHARDHEDVNVLALAADEIDVELAKKLVQLFLETAALNEPRMIRREKQLDEL
ncbi:MAG: RpiB/LacA/LacB family sugar-phosphate isomerase [Microgenomates group bacterium]